VKVAHCSQLRRALAGNEYGSSVEEYPTNMASNVNAVLAINGDFYNFRDLGITVYQRQMYRHNPKTVDTAYFTADGDMIFSKRGELADKAAAEQFVADNDVVFAVAFGPILVENGQLLEIPEKYPIGEINNRYSRAAICQMDRLHYLYIAAGMDVDTYGLMTMRTFSKHVAATGCKQAYALDGGQTTTIVLNNEVINHVNYGSERRISDIIYFATAIPQGE